MSLDCRGCREAIFEDWPKNMRAIRCGSKDAGQWRRRVVQTPKAKTGRAPTDPPAWCPKRKESEG